MALFRLCPLACAVNIVSVKFPPNMQYPSQEGSGGPAAGHQRIGFWSANMRTGAVTWDNTAAAIHGMPPGHAPSLHEALGFFLPAERAQVIQSALMALDSRTLFDIEASIQVGGGGIPIRLIGGRGYDARGDGPELHGIIETLPAPGHLGAEAGERSNASLPVAALLHELQVQIANISALSAAIEREADDPAHIRERLGRISRAAAQMQRIMDAVARLHSNALPRRERIDASRIASSVAKAHVDRDSDYARAAISIEPGIELDGDPAEVELLFDNLIGNALKFSATQPQPSVRVTSRQEHGRTVVQVRDNGTGFAQEDAVQIFQLFTRRCSPAFEGSGVGLAVAKRIVERHGGLIWARGAPGAGATFSFYL